MLSLDDVSEKALTGLISPCLDSKDISFLPFSLDVSGVDSILDPVNLGGGVTLFWSDLVGLDGLCPYKVSFDISELLLLVPRLKFELNFFKSPAVS